MSILIQIGDFILSHDFQISFWSGIGVSAVVGLIVYKCTDLFSSPNLIFVVKQNGFYRDNILLSEKGEDYEARFQFAIKNNGNKTLKNNQGYWHLFIKTNSPTIFSAPEENNHNRGSIDGTIYPGSFFDINLVYELKMKKEDLQNAKIPYFFSTDYGQYPKTAKIDPKDGKVLWKNMGHIDYELPSQS